MSFKTLIEELNSKLSMAPDLNNAAGIFEDFCKDPRIRRPTNVEKPWQSSDSVGSLMFRATESYDGEGFVAVCQAGGRWPFRRWEICITRHFGFDFGQIHFVSCYPKNSKTQELQDSVGGVFSIEQREEFFQSVRNSVWYKQLSKLKPTSMKAKWVGGESFLFQADKLSFSTVKELLNANTDQ